MQLSPAQMSLLEKFERGLDPRQPERSRIPATVLGYGEISTVFAINGDGMQGLAFKRMPLFKNAGEIQAYQATYEEYCRLLQQEAGLRLPAYGFASLTNQAGRLIFYIIQRRLPAASIGNKALHLLPPDQVLLLVRLVLGQLHRVWDYNQQQARIELGIDGQISNWCLDGFDEGHPHVDESSTLTYLDTSTPFCRFEGVEQLDHELFLRSAPPFLAWILRLLFLEDVVNRYYDFRRVAIDLVANLTKEGRPDLIPGVLEVINGFFGHEAAGLNIPPIEAKEVQSYYREDALIWTLYLSFRRFDRWLRTRILRKEYPYILPGKIQR
jgi:hypothetical protein